MNDLPMETADIQNNLDRVLQTISERPDHDHSEEPISDSTTEVSDMEDHREDDAVAEHPGNRAGPMPGIDLSVEQLGKT